MSTTNDSWQDESREWVDAIHSVMAFEGSRRADDFLTRLVYSASRAGARLPFATNTAYVNTIPTDEEPPTRAIGRSSTVFAPPFAGMRWPWC
jgi:pyruvate dehydrogenase E1 component